MPGLSVSTADLRVPLIEMKMQVVSAIGTDQQTGKHILFALVGAALADFPPFLLNLLPHGAVNDRLMDIFENHPIFTVVFDPLLIFVRLGVGLEIEDKIRKYLIPNIPYLFILWAFLKLGTAYRLAAGNDFAHKLIGLGQTIGPAFADFAPGLAPLDWLVGIVGAVGFRLLIYFKSKNAKKFRRDAEYGSARWGTEKDIKPFVDPKFENNVILTGTEFLTMNTRPKIPANARNLNCCIIGSSGSGKTRFWLTPQLLQAHSSYVVVDPKGGVLGQVGAFLQKRGYKIKVFNSIDFSKSMHYNPLAYIRNEADILKFVDALISNTKGEGKEGDPFWTKSETLLYCALIAYIIFEGPAEDRNMNTLVDMISGMEVKEDDEDFMNAVDYMFAGLEKRKPDCFAVKQYKKYKLASGKTAKSILISCGARLAPFDIPQLREVMAYDELELDRIGDRKTAVFFIILRIQETVLLVQVQSDPANLPHQFHGCLR